MQKKVLTIGFTICGLVFGSVAFVSAGEVKAREENQAKRIDQGVASGELTAKETEHLEKGEAKIEAVREEALSDGKMSRHEKKKLNHMENRQSKRIHHAKHNKKKSSE